jgi:TRAP-type C4-dicarboxylate transport system permease small subunit
MVGKPSMLDSLLKGFRRLSAGLSWLSGVGILILMVPTVLDVTNRYVFGASLPGMIEYSEVGIVLVVYLGLAKAMQDGAHISTPVVTSRLPPRAAEYSRLSGQIILWFLVAFAVWQTIAAAYDATAIREFRLGLVSVPTWQARIVVAFGFILLLIECTIQIKERIGHLRADADQRYRQVQDRGR